MSSNREKELWEVLDNIVTYGTIILIILLTLVYFGIDALGVDQRIVKFVQDIIVNLIPVFLFIVLSYIFSRRVWKLRSELETDELASKVAQRVAEMLKETSVPTEDTPISTAAPASIVAPTSAKYASVTTARQKESDHKEPLETIRFDYTDSPERHGWRFGPSKNAINPTFTSVSDGHFGKVLKITSSAKLEMDIDVTMRAARGSRVEFVAILYSDTVFYARIIIQSSDGSESKSAWLKFLFQEHKPRPINAEEWGVPVRPAELERKGDWSIFSFDLNEATAQTWGKSGWKLKELAGFRLRGSLEVAHIAVYK